MKKILLVFLAITSAKSYAQITIAQAEMPIANDSLIRYNAPPNSTLNFTTAGTNVTWDYTAIIGTDSFGNKFNSINSAPLFALATFGPLASVQHKAQLYQPSTFPFSIPAPLNALISIDSSSVKTYYQSNASNFAQVGNSAKVNGIDMPIANDSNDVIYKFPLAYGNVDSCRSIFNISNIPGVSFIYYGQNKKRVNNVEGWGTLKLPNSGVYNVLKIRSEIYEIDSLHIDSSILSPVAIGQSIPQPKRIEYKWLAQGYKIPILEVVVNDSMGTQIVRSIKYLQNGPLPAGFSSISYDNNIKIYPNPASNLLQLEIEKNNSIKEIIVCDITGKTIQIVHPVAVNNTYTLNTKNLINGIYAIKITTNSNTYLSSKFTIVK